MLSGPLYYPEDKIVNFKFNEDIENIRFNLAGSNLLYEDPDFNYVIGDVEGEIEGIMEATEWRRPKEICATPKFINSKPHRFDALQGKLEDCWAISAMEALTLHTTLIKHVVPPDQSFDENYIGAFHFRIWNIGIWYDVVVDDRLPVYKKNKKLCYCSSRSGDVFWAALLEKAYAKFWVADKVSYDVIGIGYQTTALINFTGGIVEVICANPCYLKEYGYLLSGPALRSILYDANKGNALMCCVCCSKLEESSKLGMVPGHGYTITGIRKYADDDPDFSHDGVGLFLVNLFNPWGHHEFILNWSDDEKYGGWWKNIWKEIDSMIHDTEKDDTVDDGEFWMNDVNFEKHFSFVFICHLGPGQYADTHNKDLNWTTWKTTFFRGEWVKGVTAAGSKPNNRHKLPQYGIELKFPENTIPDLKVCYVVIHLTHRAKYRRDKNKCPPLKRCKQNDLGFYIYDTTDDVDEETRYKRLGKDFFQQNEPLNDEPNWKAGDARSYTLGMFLYCGTYCIVPCTHYKDMDSQFLLRVFSTSDVADWEYDKTISKKSLIAEENINYTNNWVYTIFSEKAQEQNEVDWAGLKWILDTAFNPNCSLFEIFKCISNHILHVFGIFSSTRLSNYLRNDIVDFTKDQCRIMIAMLDQNHSGKLDISEFSELWNKINFWIKVYNQYTDETMGNLQVDQLKDALGAIGYDISIRTVHSLSYVYADDEGMILLTDFVLCGVALETAISCLEKKIFYDANKLTLSLEDWVKSTLIL